MTKLLTILTLLTLSLSGAGQGIFKKNNKLTINHTYSYVSSGSETVKCKRTPKSELDRLQSTKGIDRIVGLRIATRIINVESILDNKKEGAEGYEKAFAGTLKDLKTILDENRIELDFTDYENEFAFYQRHPVKSKEKLEKEAWENARKKEEIRQRERSAKLEQERERRQRINDSLSIVQKRQDEIEDSINQVNYKIEQQRLRQQAIANQKKWEEQRKKEKGEYEEQQKARKQLLIQKYGTEIGELIFNKKVKIGWTKEMCLESWGKPKEVNRTTTLNVVNEQWVYSLKKYLYFDNGVLTAIQD